MTLCDTGPLYALLDKKQTANALCRATLTTLSKPLITTWACFTEAMYLSYGAGGWPMQRLLWSYVEKDIVRFYTLTDTDAARMLALMEQYKDSPMDLADASLVVAAESLNLTRIFTLDRHFYAYRVHGRDAFEVVP